MSFRQARGRAGLLALAVGLGSVSAWGQQPIDTCGQLTFNATCVLFQADSGGTFVLDTADSFSSGDRIQVVGTVDAACTPDCLEAMGCITVTTIRSCGAHLSACGTLIQDGTCVLFQSDAGGTFVLDRTGDFIVGARVQVSGTINLACTTTCSPNRGCVTVGTLEACAATFAACGTLVDRGTCVVFVSDRGGTFALDAVGEFVAGDRVQVTGALDATCAPPCEPADGCITGDTIESCGTSFAGCGTLVEDAGCVLFQADAGGTFRLDNLGDFAAGTRVRVTGALGAHCLSACTASEPCIADNTIEVCQTRFADCGTLIQGAECVLFQADSGGTYVPDTTGGMAVGTRVHVEGTLDPNCVTICLPSDGCIRNAAVTAGTDVCPSAPPTSGCATAAASLVALSVLGLLRYRRTA